MKWNFPPKDSTPSALDGKRFGVPRTANSILTFVSVLSTFARKRHTELSRRPSPSAARYNKGNLVKYGVIYAD
jgi:hypothetical protein